MKKKKKEGSIFSHITLIILINLKDGRNNERNGKNDSEIVE